MWLCVNIYVYASVFVYLSSNDVSFINVFFLNDDSNSIRVTNRLDTFPLILLWLASTYHPATSFIRCAEYFAMAVSTIIEG